MFILFVSDYDKNYAKYLLNSTKNKKSINGAIAFCTNKIYDEFVVKN